jgi:hypothetical protein
MMETVKSPLMEFVQPIMGLLAIKNASAELTMAWHAIMMANAPGEPVPLQSYARAEA